MGQITAHAPSLTPAPATLETRQQPAVTLFALGMIGLGVLGLIVHDFALVWQPVAPWFPARTFLAYLAGAIMLLGGLGLLFRATSAWAVRLLLPYLLIWQFLKVPALIVAPGLEAVWLGFGELAVLFAGGWTLFTTLGALPAPSWLSEERAVRLARLWFAVWLLPIGLSHILYVPQTSALVPAWLPYRPGWAYLTGAGQIACGLGILFGILPRFAAFTEAAMISLFSLLVWAPKVAASPTNRLAWTAFLITWAIAAAAWVVAWNTPRRPSSTS